MYNKSQIHKAEHDTMRGKVKDLQEDWDKNKNPAIVQAFLEGEFKKWIVLHVARWDSETAMHIGDHYVRISFKGLWNWDCK